MRREPEPELMSAPQQAAAYAATDFSQSHQGYVELFQQLYPHRPRSGRLLDLGCGTGDVLLRFAQALPAWHLVGIDGAAAMLAHARQAIRRARLQKRVHLLRERIPARTLPPGPYAVILSSSFLHHLHEPQHLWSAIRQAGTPGTIVFVPDLRRPASRAAAGRLVARYAPGAPALLQRDFENSLCAAFTLAEVRSQLRLAGLNTLRVGRISDRHLLVHGIL